MDVTGRGCGSLTPAANASFQRRQIITAPKLQAKVLKLRTRVQFVAHARPQSEVSMGIRKSRERSRGLDN